MSTQQNNRQANHTKAVPEVVTQAFDAYPPDTRAVLMEVRDLVLEVKQEDAEIGELNETLRWGELSYLTEKPKTGSMIRLAKAKSGEPAVFFHCGTSLIETFRAQYSHMFDFEGNRALVLRLPVKECNAELKDCIKQALRYKLDN